MSQDKKCAFCPLMKEMCINGWTKSMGEDEKTGERPVCQYWTTIYGKHPQTGEAIQEGGCAIAWLPTILLENSHRQISTTSVLEDFRNKVIGILDSHKEA